jgi:hypothetical protein
MHAGSPEVDDDVRRAGGFGGLFQGMRQHVPNAVWLAREGERVEFR